MRNSFTFYGSYFEAISKLPIKEQGEFYRKLINYAMLEEEPQFDGISAIIWPLIKPNVEKSIKQYKNASQNKANEKPKESQTQAKSEPNISQQRANIEPTESQMQAKIKPKNFSLLNLKDKERDKEKEEELEIEKESEKEKENSRARFGEFQNVLLSGKELEALNTRFGSKETKHQIEALSAYMKSRGKIYKDHYATLLNWFKRDEEAKRAATADGMQTRSYSQSELDALLDNLENVEV